jgi:hypothetical protein
VHALAKQVLKSFRILYELAEHIQGKAEYEVRDPMEYFERNAAFLGIVREAFGAVTGGWPFADSFLGLRLAILGAGVRLVPLYFQFSEVWQIIVNELVLPIMKSTKSLILLRENPTEYLYRDI